MPYKQNPFSLYDFLGYLLPGALLISTILVALGQTENHDILIKIKQTKDTHLIPLALITSYITGHILGIISSITIESSHLRRNGYPSKSILNIEENSQTEVETNSFPRLMDIFFDAHTHLAHNIMRIFQSSRKDNKIDAALTEKIKEKIKRFFKEEYNYIQADIIEKEHFHAIYHFCVENTPNHLPKIQNYVALYGLMRNTALAAIVPFWIVVTTSMIELYTAIQHDLSISFSHSKAAIALISLLTFSILYYGFTKFYRRFSLEVIMAFSTCYKPEKKSHLSLKNKISK